MYLSLIVSYIFPDAQQKEDIKSKENSKKLSKGKILIKTKKKSISLKCEQIKSNLNNPARDKKNNNVTKNPLGPHLNLKLNQALSNSKSMLFSSQSITLPCTTVSLVLSYPKTNLVTMAKSAPIMATGIQPVLKCSPQLSALGPGTLIMPDGRIVPVPPAPIIVNRPAPSPALIVMRNIPPINPPPGAKPCQNSRPIAPKTKDSTKTTYVVKVPIPTVSADKNVSRILANSKNSLKRGNDSKESGNVQKHTKKKPNSIGHLKKTTVVKENKTNVSDSNLTKTNIENTNIDKPLEGNILTTDKASQNSHSDEKVTSANKSSVREDVPDVEQAKRPKVDGENGQNFTENCLPPHSSTVTIPSQSLSNNPENMVERKKSSMKDHASLLNDTIVTSASDLSKSKDNSNKLLTNNCDPNQNNQANECLQDNVEEVKTQTTVEDIPLNTESSKPILSNLPRATKELTINHEDTLVNTSNQSNTAVDHLKNKDTNSTESKIVQGVNSNIETNVIDENNIKNAPLQESNQELIDEVPNPNNTSQVESTTDNDCQPSGLLTTKTDNLKKSLDVVKKQDVENKLAVNDDNQELSRLFAIASDPKLQTCSDSLFRDADFRDRNLFMPINQSYVDDVRLSLPHSDFSNDLFSSLQVPTGGQHPESISPTAAFLLAFPLVSTSKTSELMVENDGDSQHATPTTILQIGNIDPPSNEMFHQNSLLMEKNVASLQENVKVNTSKPSLSDQIKSSSNAKPIKDVESFGKFQQLDITEIPRNENYPKTFKEKKSNCSNQDNQTYLPCKKKVNERNYSYSLHSEVIPYFQDKVFDCPVTNIKQNNAPSSIQSTIGKSSVSQKKCHNAAEHFMNTKPHFSGQSQTYNYNSFPNTNDFSLSSANYFSVSQTGSSIPKTSQSAANLNSTSFSVSNSWSTSIVPTASSGNVSSNYCAYPQRSYYVSSTSKNFSQKGVQSNFEDQGLKDRPVPASNLLPKFSNNFNFHNNHLIQDNHIYSNIDSVHCKIEHKTKKQKTSSQRGPVNWMTTPDIRPILPDPNVLPVLPDVMFHQQKEQDFSITPSNSSLNSSNNITSFTVSTPSTVHGSSQSFHHNNHFTDFQLDFAPFPEMACSTKPPKTASSISSNQQNPHYSISPSKNTLPMLPHIDTHMIPSTLPTLVGDLALGTTTPMDSFKGINMPTTPFNLDTPSKKCDIKLDSQKPTEIKSTEKDCFNSSERKNVNRIVPDFYQKSQIHQSTNTTSSFLSVSQLVDPVKSDQSNSRRGTKQVLSSKAPPNTVVHKRNTIHQPEKHNHLKLAVNSANSSACQSSNLVGNGVSKKLEGSSSYQDDHTINIGFPGSFGNNLSPPPWQNNKLQRLPTHYKGSYSAESLIGDHSAPPQDQISDLPVFPMASQYSHTPIVSSGTYTNSDFSHQNMQPLEFHQPHHSSQNCFNFPTHNSHYSSSSYNAENDYVGFDTMYGLNSLPSRAPNISHSDVKQNRNTSNKRSTSKRKEEFSSNQLFSQTPHVYHPVRSKGTSTSSPNHPGTTSLTNFNLSTIFPEINDKVRIAYFVKLF